MNTANIMSLKLNLKSVLFSCICSSSTDLLLSNTLSSELLGADIQKDTNFTDINVKKLRKKLFHKVSCKYQYKHQNS